MGEEKQKPLSKKAHEAPLTIIEEQKQNKKETKTIKVRFSLNRYFLFLFALYSKNRLQNYFSFF